jgi:penicillin-binding protein 1B
LVGAGVGLGIVIHVLLLHRMVEAFLVDRSMAPLRIFSDAFVIRRGMRPEGAHLEERLVRLGYVPAPGPRPAPGEFRVASGRIDIGLRPFEHPAGSYSGDAIRLEIDDGSVARIVRLRDGAELLRAPLEPELLGTYAGSVLAERRAVTLESLPSHVVSAVLAIEDARFAMHPGIDPIGLVRAAWVNVRGGRIVQGGSTISQQLAKNLFLTPERWWIRKANEAILALMLEAHLTKQEILELYLNNVYFGRSGTIGIYGVPQAARAFFGKDAADLTLGEAATIAGVIRAPNVYSPLRHPERAKARRDQVLELMAENEWLEESEVAAARREAVKPQKGSSLPLEAPYFVDEVLRRVRRMGYDPETVRGLAVYTTADVQAQHAAERVLAERLTALEKQHPRLRRSDQPLQGAIVLLDARTGFVRAMVGGRDFTRTQFNRVTRSRRQPGSAFKPFVYLAALDDPAAGVTPSTLLPDAPLRLRVGRSDWEPTNYDGRYLGDVTVRTAIEGSRNVPTVALARQVGLERIAGVARLAGLRAEPVVPAMTLGSAEVALLNLTAAYSVFPNLGEAVRPALIRGVMTHDGEVLYQDHLRRLRIATAQAAYVTSHLLEGVVNSGTGAAVRRLGLTEPLGGKTGTTNEEKDAWFVGYSADWVGGVWVGFDDGRPVGMTGSVAALPIWAALMREILAARAEHVFEVPAGVVFRDVDRYSGMLASFRCPEFVREAFISGTEPRRTCDGRPVEAAVFGEPPRRETRRREDSSWPGATEPRREAQSPFSGAAEVIKRWFGDE